MRILLPLAVVVFAAAVAPAQDVRLVRVPERLVLPAPAGSNLLLEVDVEPAARSVYLAREADAVDRVLLTATGPRSHQLNLADPRVLRLLAADRDEGVFHVFARFERGTAGSVAIAWQRAPAGQRTVRCFAVDSVGRKTAVPPDEVAWLHVSRLARLEVHGAETPKARCIAHAGSTTLPLSRDDGERMFVLASHDGVRRCLDEAGELDIEVRLGAETKWFSFRVVPARLEPDAERTFVCVQRRGAKVPGSRGFLEVQLDDITMGRVLLRVVDAERRELVAPRHVGEHDHVELAMDGGAYVLVVDRLRNLLIGDDYAELRVVDAAMFEPDRIAALLRRVEGAAGVTFVREGAEHSPDEAAQFLRVRRMRHKGPLTPEQFVEMAGKSSRTGQPYHVRLPNGETLPFAAWLGQQLREVQRELSRSGSGAEDERKR